MKIMRRLHALCILHAALLAVLLAALLSGIPDAYSIWLAKGEIRAAEEPGKVTIALEGANLLRVNALYLDDRWIEDSGLSRGTYEVCSVTVDRELLGEPGQWLKIELGCRKWGVINLKSTPIWIEWTGDTGQGG